MSLTVLLLLACATAAALDGARDPENPGVGDREDRRVQVRGPAGWPHGRQAMRAVQRLAGATSSKVSAAEHLLPPLPSHQLRNRDVGAVDRPGAVCGPELSRCVAGAGQEGGGEGRQQRRRGSMERWQAPSDPPAALTPLPLLGPHTHTRAALMLRLANPAERLRPPLPGSPDWEGEVLRGLRCWQLGAPRWMLPIQPQR